jgi:hypothetical protein
MARNFPFHFHAVIIIYIAVWCLNVFVWALGSSILILNGSEYQLSIIINF